MRATLVMLALILLTACDDPTVVERAAGTYELVSVGSQPLPLENAQSVWLSGSLALRDDLTFSMRNTYHYKNEPAPRTEENATGTFAITGDRIRFANDNGSDTDGLYTGDAITYGAFSYRRR